MYPKLHQGHSGSAAQDRNAISLPLHTNALGQREYSPLPIFKTRDIPLAEGHLGITRLKNITDKVSVDVQGGITR